MAKIICTGAATGATASVAVPVANSVDTHPSDRPKPAAGGGGTK